MPYTAADVRNRDFIGRILLCAPPKQGKTTCAVATSPKPVLVANTDGRGGLDPVASRGYEFDAEDIIDLNSALRLIGYARQHANDYKTVVFDNLPTFSLMIEEQTKRDLKPDGGEPDGRQFYPLVKQRLMRVIRELFQLPQHVVICGHTDIMTASSGAFGHVLALSGGAKQLIPIVTQDWIWLEATVLQDDTVKREFLLAPQGNWTKGVRSVRDVARMDADISKFLELAKSQRLITKPEPAKQSVPVRSAPQRPTNGNPQPIRK